MNSTYSQLDRPAATILTAAMTGASLPVKPVVLARLTVTRRNGWKTIVEVWQGATFHTFYHFYKQCGNKRSTKELIRTAYRDEGVSLLGMKYTQQPGLDAIAKRLEFYASQSNPVVGKKLRIIKRRAYRKLITARPDELGLTHSPVRMPLKSFSPSGSLVAAR
jgi:hypothetical protein